MSLRDEALAKARVNAQAARTAAQQQETARIARLEKWAKEQTGMPARWMERRQLAQHTYVEAGYQRTVDGVEMVTRDILAIDDIEVAAEPERYYSDKWSRLTLVHHDPERGHFVDAYSSGVGVFVMTRGGEPTMTPEEVRAEFVENVARALSRRQKHPAVVAAEKGSRCPSCGRGYDL